MKFCPNCGASLADGIKFCSECGQKIEAVASAAPVEQFDYAPQQPAAPQAETYQAPVEAAPEQSGAFTYGGASYQSYEAPQQSYEAPQQSYEAPQQSYEAPQQSYEAPQQSYEAPQQSYTAPQQSYEAPQQSYEAPQQNYYTPNSGSQPTPGFSFGAGGTQGSSKPQKGSKTGLIIGAAVGIVVVIAVVLMLILGGGSKSDPNLGVYNAVSCVSSGVNLDVEDEWIELKAKGKATLSLMGEEYACKWTLDGDELTVTQAGDEFTGTLKDGVIVLDLSGLEYTYAKEGFEPVVTEAPTEPAAAEVGYWTLFQFDTGDEATSMTEEDVESLKTLGIEFYLQLNEDGTGVLAMMDEAMELTWGNGQLTCDGESIPYTIENDLLTLTQDDEYMVFKRGEGEAPSVPAATTPVATTPVETPTEAPSAGLDQFEGDWYGWWMVDTVYEGDSEIEGYWWDTCANLQINNDGTADMILWDEDTARNDPLAEAELEVSLEDGEMSFYSVSGEFMGYPVSQDEWNGYTNDFNEEDDVLWFYGYYEEDGYAFDYVVFMLKWGNDWKNIERDDPDLLPYFYYGWYLPLIEDGATKAPNNFDGAEYVEAPTASAGTATVSADAIASGVVGDFAVSVVGAEHFLDSDGKDSVRVYYDFTNNSNDTTYAMSEVTFAFTQDGYELIDTYAGWDEEVAEEDNDWLNVRPGATIRCVEEYNMKLDGGNVDIRITDYWEENEYCTLSLDPNDLPGAPASPVANAKVSNPKWVAGYPASGTLEGMYDVSIDSVEVVPCYEGGNAVRVYLTFTNNSEEEESLWMATNIYVYQDGIQLEGTYAENENDTDDMYMTDIAVGATTSASTCYQLRSDSPIEVEIEDWDGNVLGKVFPVS